MTATIIRLCDRGRPYRAPLPINPIAEILSSMATANAAILHAQVSWWEIEYRAALRRVFGEQAVRADDCRPCDSGDPA